MAALCRSDDPSTRRRDDRRDGLARLGRLPASNATRLQASLSICKVSVTVARVGDLHVRFCASEAIDSACNRAISPRQCGSLGSWHEGKKSRATDRHQGSGALCRRDGGTPTFRTTGLERKTSPILDNPAHTPCSKDRGPTHRGVGCTSTRKTAPVSLPRPPSSEKYPLFADLLLCSTIQRARCWLASWPSCDTGAIRSARSGVTCVAAHVTHPCGAVLLT
jgi:hypothetical protein